MNKLGIIPIREFEHFDDEMLSLITAGSTVVGGEACNPNNCKINSASCKVNNCGTNEFPCVSNSCNINKKSLS